jgi:hypothetical protein
VLVDFITSTAPAAVSERQWRDLFRPPPEMHPDAAAPTPVGRGPLREGGPRRRATPSRAHPQK